jgi:hypothetical protein
MLGAARAALVLPPLTLDPIMEASEAASLAHRAATHLFGPALAAADLAGALPLQPPVGRLRRELLIQRDEALATAAELSKNIAPRPKPEMYPTVAVRIHRFVNSLVIPATASSALAPLRAAASVDAAAGDASATAAAAANRAEAICAWCEAAVGVEGAEAAPEWHGFSDILSPVAVAAREVARGLTLLCASATAASTIRSYAAPAAGTTAGVDIVAALAAALSYPPPPIPAVSHSLQTPNAARAVARRMLQTLGMSEDRDAARRTSSHLHQLAALSALERHAARAARHGDPASVEAALGALGSVCEAMHAAQEAQRAEQEQADSLYKQRTDRCVSSFAVFPSQ